MIKKTFYGIIGATSITLTGCLYHDTYTPYTSDVAVSVSSYPVDYAYYYDPVYYPVFYSSYYRPYRYMSVRTRGYRHYGVNRHHRVVRHRGAMRSGGSMRVRHGARRGGSRR